MLNEDLNALSGLEINLHLSSNQVQRKAKIIPISIIVTRSLKMRISLRNQQLNSAIVFEHQFYTLHFMEW